MRAFVVYESMFGFPRELAEAIAAGLAARLGVQLARSDEVTAADAGSAELLVAGGPTHARTLSADASREEAAAWAKEPVKEPLTDPPEMKSGRREWFDVLGTVPPLFAAFDTRTDIPRLLSGAASVRIGRELRRRGSTPVVPPESFLVTKFAGLKPGEPDRGRHWGELVADAALRAQRHRSAGTAS